MISLEGEYKFQIPVKPGFIPFLLSAIIVPMDVVHQFKTFYPHCLAGLLVTITGIPLLLIRIAWHIVCEWRRRLFSISSMC